MLMQPRPKADTTNWLFPSFRFCIHSLHSQFRQHRSRGVIPILPIFCLILSMATLCTRLGGAAQLCLERKKAMEMTRNGKHPAAPLAVRSIQDLRTELANKIAWFIGSEERLVTPIPELMLVRRTAPSAPCTGTYSPGVIVVAQGSKRVDLGQTTFVYDRSRS